MTQNGDHESNSEKLHSVSSDEVTVPIDFPAELLAAQKNLENSQKELEQAKRDFLYLRAEFDNYKRHAIKERSDLLKYGGERVLVDILNVVDNFDRALQSDVSNQNYAGFRKGIDLIANELKATLSKLGLLEIESFGKAFDPMIHEALSSEESAEIPAGHITRVFRKPYKLHEKVIRTGQVVVAKEPSADPKT